jgi:hypothetical protein
MCSNAQELEESIQETLRSGDGEVEYWEAVLQLLAVSKARARISEISTDLVAKARALQHDREGAAQQRQGAEAMGWDEVRHVPPLGAPHAHNLGSAEVSLQTKAACSSWDAFLLVEVVI